MGYLLLDRPNPNGSHFYPSRRNRVLAIVVHITAGSEDLDALDDNSAENVAQYAATTATQVSWHTGSDADSWVDLLPSSYTAWHASNYNSCTHGHEISKRTTDWRNVPAAWIEKTLRMAALGPDGHSGLRRKALELGIPFRWATKAELDHALATGGAPVGFITHAELQWEDRRDPGYVSEAGRVIDTFPRAEFMQLLTQENDVNEAQNAALSSLWRNLVGDDAWTKPLFQQHLDFVVEEQTRRSNVQFAAIKAQLAAIAANPDITPAQLDAAVDRAVAEHSATAEDIAAAMAPVVATQVVALLPRDDEGNLTVDVDEQRIAELVVAITGSKLSANTNREPV